MRPATPDALRRLLWAANRSDRELDTALIALGVLPPLDLDEIRGWLLLADVELAAGTNRDGHRVIGVALGQRTLARIHHDGRVVSSDPAMLLATA